MNGTPPRFIIHYHRTRYPHYHFRLEKNGVITSWLIPKKIPNKVGERRLAIEDGEKKPVSNDGINTLDDLYGSGEIEVWDSGIIEVKKKNNFRIEFEVDGQRLSGVYVLLLPSWGRCYRKGLWILIKL